MHPVSNGSQVSPHAECIKCRISQSKDVGNWVVLHLSPLDKTKEDLDMLNDASVKAALECFSILFLVS